MLLTEYFQNVRALEATIPTKDTVVVSLATSDGGRAGAITEVPRRVAAMMVVDRRARLATEEEIRAFRRDVLGIRESEPAAGPRSKSGK